MQRPGSAMKRQQNMVAAQLKGQQPQNEVKIPTVPDFLSKQDFVGASTLLELERKLYETPS